MSKFQIKILRDACQELECDVKLDLGEVEFEVVGGA